MTDISELSTTHISMSANDTTSRALQAGFIELADFVKYKFLDLSLIAMGRKNKIKHVIEVQIWSTHRTDCRH